MLKKKGQCIRLSYGFMRLVPRGNNPNKETLIYIPLSHVTVIQVHTTPKISVLILCYYYTRLTLISSYVN